MEPKEIKLKGRVFALEMDKDTEVVYSIIRVNPDTDFFTSIRQFPVKGILEMGSEWDITLTKAKKEEIPY